MAASAATAADRKAAFHTLTGLKRWSSQAKELPLVSRIRHLHIYDFDNTLFKSPLPNPKLWNTYTASKLQNHDVFTGGGWWHDDRILRATGEGFETEQARAWEGWWNEAIVELARLSAEENDTISVLLTGRSERNFADLVKQMVSAKRLEFDFICLKPEVGPNNQRFSSTLLYKQAFLQDLCYTYHDAKEIRIYEDRPKQVKGFRDYFHSLNQVTFPETNRKPIQASVIQVADQATSLKPATETAEVQRMINDHNAQLPPTACPLDLKKTVYYTGYLIDPADTAKLLDLVKVPPNLTESDIRYLANSILIAPRPSDEALRKKVGGFGRKQDWQVTGFSFYQSNIWAVRVNPVPATSETFTHNNNPLVVLATYKNTKPDLANNIHTWQPVPAEKQYIFKSEVGEKVQLRIETASDEGEQDGTSGRRFLKRRHSPSFAAEKKNYSNEGHRRVSGNHMHQRNIHQARNKPMPGPNGPARPGPNQNAGRGGRQGGQGGGPPGGPRAQRARPPRPGYKSLDDVGASETGRFGVQRGEPSYEDYSPAGGQYGNAFPALNPLGMDASGGLNYGK